MKSFTRNVAIVALGVTPALSQVLPSEIFGLSFSPQCQAAVIGAFTTGGLGQCFPVADLLPLLTSVTGGSSPTMNTTIVPPAGINVTSPATTPTSGSSADESIVPVLDNFMSDLCYNYPPCSNETLANATQTIIAGCSADLANGSLPNSVVETAFALYPTIREVLCLKTSDPYTAESYGGFLGEPAIPITTPPYNATGGTFCVTSLLTQLSAYYGTNLTVPFLGGIITGQNPGASGYIASWLVKLLLERGYTVRATVRDTADPKKTSHLHALDGAKDRLHLFKASLLEEGSFDAAIDGCECVFHTASPFYHNIKDPQAELLDPAVKGTLNVLGSCKKASIKRVVVTSSMAAVAYNGKPKTPDVVVDETWFSLPEFCEKTQQWYVLSKTLAEEAAWKFSKDNGLEIVTINPTMVIGPLLQPTLNTSAEAILKLINGSSSTYPNFSFGWINVKDVALAHIHAYEVPSANGRYCMVERVAHYSEVVKIIREMYPNIRLPNKCADDKPFFPTYQVSKDKIRGLGIELIPLETSINETIESLKEKGFVTFESNHL